MRRAAILLLVCAACASTAPTPKPEMNDPVPAAPWRLTYADGSANIYRWWQEQAGDPIRFVYEPVTPERSSTGSYSGGPPREEQLAAGDPRMAELWARARALKADTTHHVPDRNKGTGLFTWKTAQGEEQFIVAMGERLDTLKPLLDRFGR